MTKKKEAGKIKRRDFIKKVGVGAAAVAATAVNAPFVHAAKKSTIKWRMQTYAGPALAAHVAKPFVDAFNKAEWGNDYRIVQCRSAGTPWRTVQSHDKGHHRFCSKR